MDTYIIHINIINLHIIILMSFISEGIALQNKD